MHYQEKNTLKEKNMDLSLNIHNLFFNTSPEEIPLEQGLQNAIRSNDLTSLEELIEQVDLTNKLPNGELPIHFAVLEGQAEVVRFLVEKGANPMEKDFQGLTAVDHAFLHNKKDILTSLLGKKVNKQLAAAISEQSTSSTRHALKEIGKASLEITSSREKELFTPVQQAIISNDYGTLKCLLENPRGNRDLTPSKQLSLLHLAAMGSSPDIVDLLVNYNLDLEAKDNFGRTAAHYAAINPNGVVLGRLIKHGANLSVKDANGVSPLSLLGASAQLRDPLNLTTAHALMFAATVVQAAATMGIQTGLIGQEHEITATIVVIGAAVANLSEIAIQLQNIDKTWKNTLSYLGILGFQTLPIVGTPFKIWRAYRVTQSAFNGLKAAYNNARYRTWKAARNAVVYTTNGGTSINRLWGRIKVDYEIGLNGYHWYKILLASNDDDTLKAYEEYLRFLRGRYGFDSENHPHISMTQKVDPSKLAGLSVLERLNKKELNPTDPEQALMMMHPDFTLEQLNEHGSDLYLKIYRKLMLKDVHPDKVGDEGAESAAVRLNVARDTLDKYVKNHR